MKSLFLKSILFICACISAYGNNPHTHGRFKQYNTVNINNGLSQSTINTTCLDEKGNLWIGTNYGLNKYVSGKIKNYYYDSNDSYSINSNKILFIMNDKYDNLWIGTTNGICKYDYENDCFIRQTINGNKSYSAGKGICIDGIPYVSGISSGLNLYTYDNNLDDWKLIKENEGNFYKVESLSLDSNNNILITTAWSGVYMYSQELQNFQKLNFLESDHVLKAIFDNDDNIWCSIYGKGIKYYKKGELKKSYNTSNSSLGDNVILDILEKDNKLWLASEGAGLFVLDTTTNQFESYEHIIDNKHSFPTDNLTNLYSKGDYIYAGSKDYGLIVITNTPTITYNEVNYNCPFGISNNNVSSCYKDEDGTIWIGTDGGGLNSMNKESSLFTHYNATYGMSITSIINYSQDQLLLSAYNKGLFLFDKKNKNIIPFSDIDPKTNKEVFQNANIIHLHETKDNKIIINSKNIYIYDKKQKKLTYIDSNKYKSGSPTAIGDDGNIYYAKTTNTIWKYDIQTGTGIEFAQGSYNISDICCVNDNLWFADDTGLGKISLKNKKYVRYSTPLFNEALLIVYDRKDRIWVGTHNGLFMYSVYDEKFYRLNKRHGISSNEYSYISHCLLDNGDIIIGGLLGLTHISEEIDFKENECHEILINELNIDGDLSNKKLNDSKNIKLRYNYSNIKLSVVLKNNNPLSENLFNFSIKNEKDEIISHSMSGNELIIGSYPSGKYTIDCQYYTSEGIWSSAQKLLSIFVEKPWWNSTWFILSSIGLSLLIIFLITFTIIRKKKEKDRRAIEEMKDKLNKDKINYLTNISHELRTPLTLICSPLKRIISSNEENPNIQNQLKGIYLQANQMKTIIDMVLDVRKFEDGNIKLLYTSNDLNKWILNVCSKFETEFQAKGINLEYILEEPSPILNFDKRKCEFVVSNFMMNALKFSNPNSTTKILTKVTDDGFVRISVNDEGIGLKMVNLDKLFSNFYQEEHNKGGSGIGLSYSKTIIEYHNGRIGAQNNDDVGATFYFELPLNNKHNHIKENEIDKDTFDYSLDKSDLSQLKNLSIIIIDDNSELRTYLKDHFKNYFKKVYTASNGKEGYDLIVQTNVDIIVSDVIMPVMNGFELCETIKKDIRVSHTLFVLLTAYDSPQNTNIGYKTGADIFIGKPFEIDTLILLINNNIKTREQIKQKFKRETHDVNLIDMCYSNADEIFLSQLNDIVINSLDKTELNVDYLAKNLCVSRSLLFTKVKTLTGLGIVDYVNNKKIHKATELLKHTDNSITTISEMVGFSSPKYFTKVFKGIIGVSPSNYRNKQHSNL